MHVLLQFIKYQSKSYYIIGQEVYYSIGRFITLSGVFYYIIGRFFITLSGVFLLHYRAVITVSGVYYIIGWYRCHRLSATVCDDVQRNYETAHPPQAFESSTNIHVGPKKSAK